MQALQSIRNRVRKLGRSEGFTLIELAVALAILGILVAIAVPTYLNVRNRSYDSEAKQTLGEIRAVVWSHYLEQGEWPGSIEAVGYEVNAAGVYETDRWEYTISAGSAGGSTYICAVGLANEPTSGRTWRLTLDTNGRSELEGPNAPACP